MLTIESRYSRRWRTFVRLRRRRKRERLCAHSWERASVGLSRFLPLRRGTETLLRLSRPWVRTAQTFALRSHHSKAHATPTHPLRRASAPRSSCASSRRRAIDAAKSDTTATTADRVAWSPTSWGRRADRASASRAGRAPLRAVHPAPCVLRPP